MRFVLAIPAAWVLPIVATAQVQISIDTSQIPVGSSEVRLFAELPADADEDLGIAAVLIDLATTPGLTATGFEWSGGLTDTDEYYSRTTLPRPQTAYFGAGGFGVDLPRGSPVFIGTLQLATTIEGTFEIDLNMEMAEDESFVGMAVIGDVLTVDAVHTVIDTTPARGAIDARQPSAPDGGDLVGWTSVILTFNGGEPPVEPAMYTVLTTPSVDPPLIESIVADGLALTVTFDRRIPPGAWTEVLYAPSSTGARLGFLPGDVDGDGRSGARDVLALIDTLNGIAPRPDFATDLDRSGALDPTDILRHLDLLNGVGVYEVWNGRSLP